MRYTHGDTGTRLYRIWKSMKCRCLNSNHPTYKNYGARGISICKPWYSYESFKSWSLLNGYGAELELDRINVNGDYEPSNCRWISHHEQTVNRRDTLYVVIGHEKPVKLYDYCKRTGLSRNTANDWRHRDLLEMKLSEREQRKVVVIGGKKNHTKL